MTKFKCIATLGIARQIGVTFKIPCAQTNMCNNMCYFTADFSAKDRNLGVHVFNRFVLNGFWFYSIVD